MSAVPMFTLTDFYTNIIYLLEQFPESTLMQAEIAAEILLNPAWALVPFDVDERNEILKRSTAYVAALDPDINCYPRGAATAQCFDLDGNEIP
jgi:hypothetical protein